LICIGGGLRITSRVTLKKAGFGMVNSYKLQIVGGQRLITTGLYSRIRHPLYLGEMTRNLGLAILFSSLYGLVLVTIANFFLLIRIEIEEKMLISEFGQEYEEYKKKTKKLLPCIY
jgi:protein-S-isoprenylcysteine O-methyltransferase Ste14